ncbi:MAG: glycosyltransferase [Planctomycetota bacterium]
MKVLVVANGFPPTGRFGTEFYAGELARGLRSRGAEVRALCIAKDGEARRERTEGAGGVPLDVLHLPHPPSRDLVNAYRSEWVERVFAEVVREFAPDVVHFLQLLWGLSTELPRIAKEAGARTVLTLTDYGLVCHRGQMFTADARRCGGPHPATTCAPCLRRVSAERVGGVRASLHALASEALALAGGAFGVVTVRDVEAREAAVRRAFAHVDAVVAPTPSMARAFAGLAPGAVVLPYAFDEEPFAAVARPHREGVRRVGFLGQLAPHKGAHVLLEAVRLLRARPGARTEFALHGAAPSGEWSRYARRLLANAPEGVSIEPAFEPADAPQVLARLDAVAVPSLWDENAPLVCLQARAAGVPIAASDVPGIAAVVEEGVHGALAAPGDARALADAIDRALDLRDVPRGLPVGFDRPPRRDRRLHHSPA